MEQDSVNQRLNLVVDHFEKGVKAAFARKIGISPQGAQELLAGRKGGPSFKVLTKILESYPVVDANWLVMGRGSMLQDHTLVKLTQHEFNELTGAEIKELTREAADKVMQDYMDKNGVAVIAEAIARREREQDGVRLMQMYSFGDTVIRANPMKLSERLGISEDETAKRVYSCEIRSIKISDREGFRISEEWVREYLDRAVNLPASE